MTRKNTPCNNKSSSEIIDQAPHLHYCGTHLKIYKRENPTTRLVPTDTIQSKAIVQILNAMKTPQGRVLVDKAFRDLFTSRVMYDPSENIHKFMTGGIAEQILTELIQSLGFPTANVSATRTLIDIEVEVGCHVFGISLKSSGGIHQQPILENYRGESKTEIRDLPMTLIIYTEPNRARIVYLDNDILRQAYPTENVEEFNASVYKGGHAQASLTFKSGFLKQLIPRLPDAYIVNGTFPTDIPNVGKRSIVLIGLEYMRSVMRECENEFTGIKHTEQ